MYVPLWLVVVPDISLVSDKFNGARADRVCGNPALTATSRGLQEIFWSPFSLLLVFVPLGFLSATHEWGDGWIFILNFIAASLRVGGLGLAKQFGFMV